MAVSTSRLVGSEEEDDPDFSWDFSGLPDPSVMRDFMSACDYCLSGCSDDDHSLDDEGYGPSRECFHIDQGDHDEDNHLSMPEDDDAPVPTSRIEISRELAVVQVPAGGQDTKLEQLREMQAKLDEETGWLVQLRQDIEQEWAGRALAGGARHRARDVQRHIIDDARAGLPRPSAGPARTQLQRRCYFKQCQSHPPPRGGVSRANSRISWKMPQSGEPRALPPKGEGAPRSIAQRPPDACGRPRFAPSAHGTGRPQPRIASAMSNTAATVEPVSRRGCVEATTPGAEDATTVRRIGAPRPNHQIRESSAGPYDGRRSRPGSEPRLASPSTQGIQGQSCGLRITVWRASWEGRTMTTSSSATSPFSSPTLPGPGWSICLLRRSPTGTT
jgi:hypothetical protein